MTSAARASSSSRSSADPGVDLGRVHGRVEDLPLLPPGAADQHGVDPLGVVAGNGPGPLGRLVIGVGMDGKQAERLRHGASRYRAVRP